MYLAGQLRKTPAKSKKTVIQEFGGWSQTVISLSTID